MILGIEPHQRQHGQTDDEKNAGVYKVAKSGGMRSWIPHDDYFAFNNVNNFACVHGKLT